MSLRALVVLAILVVAAFAALIYLDRSDTSKGAAETTPALIDVPVEAIEAVEIVAASETFRLVRRDGDAWAVVSREEDEADPRRVRELLASLTGARSVRTVEENAKDLSAFGLDPPERTVTIAAPSRSASVTLAFGRISPVGWHRYLTVLGSRRVLLVDGALGTSVDRSFDAFIETRLLPIEPEHIRRIEIERSGTVLALAGSASGWRIERPFADDADAARCDRLARAIASLSFRRRLPPSGPLPHDRMVVRVGGADDAKTLTTWIATDGQNGERLASREGSAAWGTVDDVSVRDIEVAPDGLRDRALASFSTPAVREIRCVAADRNAIVRRDAEGAPWRRVDRAGAPDPDPPRVEALLDATRWLRADRFGGSGNPGPESGRLELRDDAGELVVVQWGPGEDAGDRWIRSSRRPGLLAWIAASTIADLEAKIREVVP